jgi:hypothetical protein
VASKPSDLLVSPGAALVHQPPELLGHADVRTTMICTHVLNKGGWGVRGPLDAM